MIWFLPVAFANTWAPYDGDFLVTERDDAPTDAVLLYAANYEVTFRAVDGNGIGHDLTSELVTGVGARPVVSIAPPQGGWGAGETWELTRSPGPYDPYVDDPSSQPREIVFTTGTATALTAAPPEIADLFAGEWSEPTMYAWGCCEPIRTIDVAVIVDEPDPWAWVEIVGEFDLGRPSQITTQEIHTHLDVAVGPGAHVLKLTQWLEDEVPQPPCFAVVPMSAAGVAGPSETICTDVDGIIGGSTTGGPPTGGPSTGAPGAGAPTTEDPREPTGVACATGPAIPGLAWLAPLLLLVRRRVARSTVTRRPTPPRPPILTV